MVYTEIHGNELYVYMNGSLLYKRWMKQKKGMIFCPIQNNYVPSIDTTESIKDAP